MSPFVKVFGCRPRRTMPQALAAGVLVFRPDMIFRIRRPKKLGRSGESPVPQPWSIFAEPVKVGDEWYVLARHPSGQHVHVRRFKTQGEASFGSPESQKLGSKNRATSMTSRQMISCHRRGPIEKAHPQDDLCAS
jgi:hypothetical protein